MSFSWPAPSFSASTSSRKAHRACSIEPARGPLSSRQASRVDIPAARGRLAGVEAGPPRLRALLGGPVVVRVSGVEVTHGERRVQRLLHVTVLEAIVPVGAVGPRSGVAVGLELEAHGRNLAVVRPEQAEFVLDLVAVLVGDD